MTNPTCPKCDDEGYFECGDIETDAGISAGTSWCDCERGEEARDEAEREWMPMMPSWGWR